MQSLVMNPHVRSCGGVPMRVCIFLDMHKHKRSMRIDREGVKII